MIENILILDTETTGLDSKKDKVIEIAVILYNLQHKSILQSLSTLFPCDENPVEHINGIKAEATKCAMPFSALTARLKSMIQYSQAIVAHNASFDRAFVKESTINEFESIPWICTKDDFEWPVRLPRKRLMDVCEAMGVQYINAHRALQDCLFLVDCFNKVEDLQKRFNTILTRKLNEKTQNVLNVDGCL